MLGGVTMTDDDIPLHLMYGANHLAMDEAFRPRMHAANVCPLAYSACGRSHEGAREIPPSSECPRPMKKVGRSMAAQVHWRSWSMSTAGIAGQRRNDSEALILGDRCNGRHR